MYNSLKQLFASDFRFFNPFSCNKYLLSTYYMLSVLGTEYASEQKELGEFIFLVEEIIKYIVN